MRALLAHPLYRLIPRLLATLLFVAIAVQSFAQVPRSIGPVSDYGAVLDRHGRERIEGLIEETRATYGVSVMIFADWQNPYPDAGALARALLNAWGIAPRTATLLAVFIRTDVGWDHAVVGTAGLPDATLPQRLTDGVADLVFHGRIEEAMVALFDLIGEAVEPAGRPNGETPERGSPVGWLTGGILLAAGALIVLIHRRLCPRCGRILRVERVRRHGESESGHRVYYCRSCGFRRPHP